MIASTDATRLFCDTAWMSKIPLAREMRTDRIAKESYGIPRLFIYTANDVQKIVPAYGHFVAGEVQKLGWQHSLVKTQYFCKEIDEPTGMFGAARQILMLADQPPQEGPILSHIYALTVDVGGQDETVLSPCERSEMGNPSRDYVTMDIKDIALSHSKGCETNWDTIKQRFLITLP